MRRRLYPCAPLALVLAAGLQSCRFADSTAGDSRSVELYRANCEVCHGPRGTGDGPAAYLLFPKPRDFTRAYYKVRTTASGSLPTDDDLFQTITNGMPGSAMPGFQWLSEEDRWALVSAVKGFADEFQTLEPEPLEVPPEPPPADSGTLSRGAEKYRELGCWKCHGEQGRGDGPSARGLTDDRDHPIRPNDFTRGIYKGGGTLRDIYTRFATGMDGTPMPSYEGTATSEDIWALVRYVKSLAGSKVAVQPSTGRLIARRIDGVAPRMTDDPRWREANRFQVPLMLLWQRQHAVEGVEVRAVHDGHTLAILISWADPTPAWSVLRNTDFADGVAVQFSLSTPPPHFAMGSEEGQVNIWHWRADRQLDLARRRGLEDIYAAAAGDAAEGSADFLTAADAGNLVASRPVSAVQDLNAEGFGTLTTQPAADQNVTATAAWVDGRWRVVVRRALETEDRGDVSLASGQVVPAAFAVWDGDHFDRNGQKAVSSWYELEIQR